LPIVATLEATVDFLISTAVLLVLLPMYGIWPSWRLLALPLLLLALTSLALGAGLWLSATNLRYRGRHERTAVCDAGAAVQFSGRHISSELIPENGA
jgi:lipopolysaccharide transport system permease protein